MDITLTEALIQEGQAREIVNRIQKTRKDIGLDVSDRIKITYATEGQLDTVCQQHQNYILKETLCIDWSKSSNQQAHQFDIDGLNISFMIEKVS